MLEVAAIGSRAGSQALGEVCHRLVDVVLWQLFPDGLQSDFQLINRLGIRLNLWYVAEVIVQWVQIWRLWGPLIRFNERRTDCLQPVLRGACRVRWDAVLLEDVSRRRLQCTISSGSRRPT